MTTQVFIDPSASAVVLLEGKLKKFEAILAKANEINGNGRFYPEEVLFPEVERLKPLVEAGQLTFCLDHPNNGQANLKEACAVLRSIRIKGNLVIGTGDFLDTQAGRDALALHNAGVTIEVSSRGTGSTLRETRDGKECDVIQPDYRLAGFDFVSNGSTGDTDVRIIENQRAARQALTIQERRMLQLAGLPMNEWAYPQPGQPDGYVSSDYAFQVDDKKMVARHQSKNLSPTFRRVLPQLYCLKPNEW